MKAELNAILKSGKIFILFCAFPFTGLVGMAQTTAWDFSMTDCNGNMHQLFSELDSGNVVILEFFMISCTPCIDAGKELDPMFQKLKAVCSPKIKFYHFGYTNSYTCAQVTNWVSTNGFTSVPFDSGAVQVAYYNGMGMPTIAVVAGPAHKVLHTTVGYTTGDTAVIADSIRAFFNCAALGVPESISFGDISVYPSPSSGEFAVRGLPASPAHVQVYNGMGEKILELRMRRGEEHITLNEPDGIYFIRGEINGGWFTRKVIVQNK